MVPEPTENVRETGSRHGVGSASGQFVLSESAVVSTRALVLGAWPLVDGRSMGGSGATSGWGQAMWPWCARLLT